MSEGPPGDLRQPSSPMHPAGRHRADTGGEHPGLAQMDVGGAVLPREHPAVALGHTPHHALSSTVLVVNGAASVHCERRTGGMLDLVKPLPIGDDRPTDDQATHREHNRRAAILSLHQTVDLADHDFQRPVDLRVRMVGHPSILLSPSTGPRCNMEPAAVLATQRLRKDHREGEIAGTTGTRDRREGAWMTATATATPPAPWWAGHSATTSTRSSRSSGRETPVPGQPSAATAWNGSGDRQILRLSLQVFRLHRADSTPPPRRPRRRTHA